MPTASTRLAFVTDANNGIGFEVVRKVAASHCPVLISPHNMRTEDSGKKRGSKQKNCETGYAGLAVLSGFPFSRQ